MACAKPVVVTRSGGMVESVLDGETGFIIDKRDSDTLAEKLLLFLGDKELAAQFGRRGRQHAEQVFSRERMARETADLYAQALEDSKTRAAEAPVTA
jgi:glycosyltransferase involved in cell wall biosynthesis